VSFREPKNKKALLLDYNAEPLSFIHPPGVKVKRKRKENLIG
jgi:hypothetical protein